MADVYMCFECDARQGQPGPCQVCGGSCEMLPAGDEQGKTLMVVFAEDEARAKVDPYHGKVRCHCGGVWCLVHDLHWHDCGCPSVHDTP